MKTYTVIGEYRGKVKVTVMVKSLLDALKALQNGEG